MKNFPIFLFLTLFLWISIESAPKIIKDILGNQTDYSQWRTSVERTETIDIYQPNLVEERKNKQNKLESSILLRLEDTAERILWDEEHLVKDKIQIEPNFQYVWDQFFQKDNESIKSLIEPKRIVTSIHLDWFGKNGLLSQVPLEWGTESFPVYPTISAPPKYTGVIIDARMVKINPSIFPKIQTEKGQDIYSLYHVKKTFGLEFGLVSFEVGDTKGLRRVGNNPYICLAVGVSGFYQTNPVITEEDAIRILSSSETRENLKKAKLVILVSK